MINYLLIWSMQDILKKYKQHKFISNLGIVVTSLIVAVWINFFVIDSTNIGQNIKTSVLNASINQNLADIYLEKKWDNIVIKTSKNINNLKSLSFNVSYNPETLIIENITSNITSQVLNLSNNPWINSVTLILDIVKDINKSEVLAIIKVKKMEEKTENINIFDARFNDNTAQTSLLTTSWISF